MEEIRVSALTVTGTPVPGIYSGTVSSGVACSSVESNVLSFQLQLCNGIEIKQENVNLDRLISLLQSLRGLC